MKTLFIEARYAGKPDFSKIKYDQLPKNLIVLTTVQFLDHIDALKRELEKKGKNVKFIDAKHAAYRGQILGCSLTKSIDEKTIKNTDAFLYLGDGLFHPKQLLLKNNIPVFIFNPRTQKFSKLTEDELGDLKRRMKAALLKFYSCQKIGIIVSTKPGQNKLKAAESLKETLEKNKKKAFIFISDTIDFNELENFPFIDIYINTACPRITYDDYLKFTKPIIDLEDLPDEYTKKTQKRR